MNHEQLMKFCNPNDIRHYCAAPQLMPDGRVCATNGHIFILAEKYDGGAVCPAIPENIGATVLKNVAAIGDAKDWASIESLGIVLDKCGECHGVGTVTSHECDDCDGRGEFAHGNHDYECAECDGTGRVRHKVPTTCDVCRGTGHAATPIPIAGMNDGVGVDGKYLSMFPAGAEYCGDQSHVLVRGDGFVGAVMGYRL